MSNLLTLSQDEITRFNLKGKEVGDVITAEEYSKLQKEYESSRKSEDKAVDTADKYSKHQKEYEANRNKSEDKPAVDTKAKK